MPRDAVSRTANVERTLGINGLSARQRIILGVATSVPRDMPPNSCNFSSNSRYLRPNFCYFPPNSDCYLKIRMVERAGLQNLINSCKNKKLFFPIEYIKKNNEKK